MKLHDPFHMIFVFGSNLSGIHGAGAAKFAYQRRGAVMGLGEGMSGQSYALPTKGINITHIPLDEVHKHVQKFLKYSYDTKNKYSYDTKDVYEYQITRVGTGLSGFRDEDIAEMFEYVAYPESNCFFDTAWEPFLPKGAKFWGTF